MDKGIIQIYYGEGQGKTSAALGNAIRKASNGQTAYVVQFMKGQLDTEYLTRLEPEVKVFCFPFLLFWPTIWSWMRPPDRRARIFMCAGR
mgnify:CR=1 FL=1